MFKFRSHLKQYKFQLIVGPLCKLAEAVFELMIPLIMAKIIDTGIARSDLPYIIQMGFLMLLLCVLGLVLALICQYCASVASQGFGTSLRSHLFSHINTFSYKQLDELPASSMITRITSDINQLQLSLAMVIRLVTRAPFLAIGSIIMAMTIHFKLSLIFLAAAFLIGLTLYLIMSKSVSFYKAIQNKLDDISLLASENLSGNRVIRALNRQQQECKRFEKNTGQLSSLVIKVSKISALLNPLTYTVANLAIVYIVWNGAKSVDSGGMLTGEIVALVNYMTQILLSMIVLAMLVVYFTKAAASQQRVRDVFNMRNDAPPTVQEQDAPPIPDTPVISFRNVSFSYGGGVDALFDLSFDIYKNETVGIIGGTGSGKTSLINLIPHFYKASRGSIYVNGRNVNSYPPKALRQKISIAPQNSVLMSGTVRENMIWGKPDAQDTEIMEAMRIVQLEDFIHNLRDGFSTQIYQSGKNLSGGQKQRMAIARAIIPKPEILILDDSFSALDYITDKRLRQALRDNAKDTTTLIVSQRIATIKDADKIIFLDDGCLAGFGTHPELMASCNAYKEMYDSQGA